MGIGDEMSKRDRYADDLWHFLDFDASTDVPLMQRRIIHFTSDSGNPMERFETHEEIVRAAWEKGMAEYDQAHNVKPQKHGTEQDA